MKNLEKKSKQKTKKKTEKMEKNRKNKQEKEASNVYSPRRFTKNDFCERNVTRNGAAIN